MSHETQFRHLSSLVMQEWVQEGGKAEASWFSETYLHEDWNRWWITSLLPGNIPNNNPLESSNRKDKRHLHYEQVSMTQFFQETIAAFFLSYRRPNHLSNLSADDQEAYLIKHSVPKSIFMNSTPSTDDFTDKRIQSYLSMESPANVTAAVTYYMSLNQVTRTERPDA